MVLRNYSYVKRGAIFGGFISVINNVIALISWLLILYEKSSGLLIILTFPSLLIHGVLYFSICGYEGPKSCETAIFFLSIIISIIILTGIGALIGWTIGKIKSK